MTTPPPKSSSSNIPQNWVEAENNVSQLVNGLISAASSYGVGSSAAGRTLPFRNSNVDGSNNKEEIPSPKETIGFMKAACNIIIQLWPDANEQQQSSEKINDEFCAQAVQHVLFDASHELLSVLWMFVVPPRNPWMAATASQIQQDRDGGASSFSSTDIKASAFRAIKALALLCARDQEGLAFMFRDIVVGERGLNSITRCLCSAASTSESRCAAAELLLVLTLQLGMTQIVLTPNTAQSTNDSALDIALLVNTTLAEPEATVRSFILASVQGCIAAATTTVGASNNNDPISAIASLCSTPIVSSLLRLIAADDTRDVRCVATLCVQALMSAIPLVIINSNSPNRNRRSALNNNNTNQNHIISLSPSDYLSIAECSIGRLFALLSPVSISYPQYHHQQTGENNEDDGNFEAMEEEIVSLLQLLESITIAAASVGNEQVFVALRQRNIAKTLILRMNQGNGTRFSASPLILQSVLKCIRIMLELSPPFASQALQLAEATPMTALFKLCLSLPSDVISSTKEDHETNHVSYIASAALDLQLILGLIFCFSADARSTAVAELSNKTFYAFSGVLRDRCKAHSSLRVIERFYQQTILGIELRDENHSLLNDETLSQLRFTPAGDAIDEESCRLILDGQQLRALPSTSSSSPNHDSRLFSSSTTTATNRVEATEHWRSCAIPRLVNLILISQQNNTRALPQNTISVLQHRAAIMVGLVRHVIQSVLATVCEINEANKRNQQQYLGQDDFSSSTDLHPNNSSVLTSSVKLSQSSPYDTANNNNNINAETDPNERFVADNSPMDESYGSSNTTNLLKSQAAKRFIQGNAELSSRRSLNNNTNASESRQRSKQHQQQAEKILNQVNNSLYSEFDACLRLVLAFAEHFTEEETSTANNKKSVSTNATTKSSQFIRDARQPGLMMRKTKAQQERESNNNSKNSKLRNPWAAKRLQYTDTKSWNVDAVQEGDLFYFSVQVISLNANVLDAIVAKARSHYMEIKKLLAVTPNTVLNRRHFLSEMANSVMPNVIALLQKLQKIVATQGEGHVQTALALCPELNNQQQHQNQNQNQQQSPFIDCGNVVPVVEFLLQYFSSKLYSMGLANVHAVGNNSKSLARRHHHHHNHQVMMGDTMMDDQQQQQQNDVDAAGGRRSSSSQQRSVEQILASLGSGDNNSNNNVFDDF